MAVSRVAVVLGVLLFLNSFDAIATLVLLETKNAWEANPLLAAAYQHWGIFGFLGVKFAVVGIGCTALWKGRDLPTPTPVAYGVAIACLLVFLYEVVAMLLLAGGYL